MKRARNHERKKNRDVKFIENSDMKKLDKLMGSLDNDSASTKTNSTKSEFTLPSTRFKTEIQKIKSDHAVPGAICTRHRQVTMSC